MGADIVSLQSCHFLVLITVKVSSCTNVFVQAFFCYLFRWNTKVIIIVGDWRGTMCQQVT